MTEPSTEPPLNPRFELDYAGRIVQRRMTVVQAKVAAWLALAVAVVYLFARVMGTRHEVEWLFQIVLVLSLTAAVYAVSAIIRILLKPKTRKGVGLAILGLLAGAWGLLLFAGMLFWMNFHGPS